ncbi:Gcd10p family-domain-containing protein [Infundibulicybe gibba]|nr:Gcd10p family-domain-containing protein [Infundibulicybe gibba]
MIPAANENSPRDVIIHSGDMVLLRLLNGEIRGVRIDKNSTIALGRLGSFFANGLINQPYGLTYEMVDKSLKVIPPRSLQEVEDTDATNELINDGEFVQPLTLEEIQALKQAGVHASDIIKKQIEQHANYSLKTEYSKEKYKKRKEAKYSKSFTTIEPTLFNVCDYWFNKDQNRIRDIRVDTLAQILNLANIKPGGRYIAVDDASGLVVAGILERMGGEGKLITVHDADSPPAYPVLANMNFKSHVVIPVLISLNWASVQEITPPSVTPPVDLPSEQIRSDRQKARLNKRKAVSDLVMNTREELFGGGFDSLIIASEYDPYSIIEQLAPYVGGSGSIVVHSPYIQVILADLQTKLRALPIYLCPTVTEAWLRRYQVLPGRTHPMMARLEQGGIFLARIKCTFWHMWELFTQGADRYDDEAASAVQSHRGSKANETEVFTSETATPDIDQVLQNS